MAEIKNTMTVSLEEFGQKAGEYALDKFEYKGLTIRQWADKITSGEYQAVKHGHWIEHPDDIFPLESTIECSVCGEQENLNIHNDNYCPNCGCKLDLGGD